MNKTDSRVDEESSNKDNQKDRTAKVENTNSNLTIHKENQMVSNNKPNHNSSAN